MTMKGYSSFHKALALLKPHHYCHIQDTHWGSLNPLQRCSQCILPPQSTRPTVKSFQYCYRILIIQFFISHLFEHKLNSFKCSKWLNISFWPIDRTLTGTSTQGHSGSGSNWNEGVLCISQSSSITEASTSNCFVSYLGHLLGESYSSIEMQSVYSAAPVDLATGYSLKESYLSAKMHLVYSVAPVDKAISE